MGGREQEEWSTLHQTESKHGTPRDTLFLRVYVRALVLTTRIEHVLGDWGGWYGVVADEYLFGSQLLSSLFSQLTHLVFEWVLSTTPVVF
jgi:hypothetical protein